MQENSFDVFNNVIYRNYNLDARKSLRDFAHPSGRCYVTEHEKEICHDVEQ